MTDGKPDQRDAVEQALRDGELYKMLLDQLEEGIYIVDCDRRILYWNGGAERITGYHAHEVVGQLCHGDLLMHCDCSGTVLCGTGCPLKSVMNDGAPRECTIFLRHSSGHRVPVQVRSRAICQANGEKVGAVEVFVEAKEVARPDLSDLVTYGCVDQLTGALKRSFGEMKARQAVEALNEFGIPFGWVRVALDDVAEYEHRYGHGIIDAAVKMVASTLSGSLKTLDWLTYWGHGEFRIEARGYSLWELEELRRTLQMLVRASNLAWWGDPVRVTVSIASRMAEHGDTLEWLEQWASEALAGQAGGKN